MFLITCSVQAWLRSIGASNQEIFKPEFEESGISAIGEYLTKNKITPTVIIHRGHSYHTESTLEKIPAFFHRYLCYLIALNLILKNVLETVDNRLCCKSQIPHILSVPNTYAAQSTS